MSFKKRTSKATVQKLKRPQSFEQRMMLPAVIKGLGITMRHFFNNVAGGEDSEIVTLQYPEEKVEYPARFRGLHRLMHREDGEVRCVACMCCPTACPAHCITIVPEETTRTVVENGSNHSVIEKRPAIFEIDELRCIACGLCVEACPCDAIRMDSGEHAHPTERRVDAILGKTDLLSRGTQSTAIQGGIATWRDQHLPAETPAHATPAREVQPHDVPTDKSHH